MDGGTADQGRLHFIWYEWIGEVDDAFFALYYLVVSCDDTDDRSIEKKIFNLFIIIIIVYLLKLLLASRVAINIIISIIIELMKIN